ncbi:MAG: sugar transferase [Desulfobacula sp. GWF2_41_7]|nr:MAG: sugar transferase [Desulfobacula sp. GWF2_41_7]
MKRIFDLSVSLILLWILSPLFILIAILVGCKLGRPILFTQMRPGFKGQSFIIYKFRSLTDEKDRNGNLLPDTKRFTRFSSLIRRSSLDELPELINVLKGDMSLVGPRPLLMQYLDRYDAVQARRHDVKPGITGWAQVNGRNAVSWEEKFKMDVWYVDNFNFWLDLKILWLTLFQVCRQEGIQQKGHVTAEEFLGVRKDE